MRKLVLWGILILLFMSPAYAVSISNLSIADKLDVGLSMRETIMFNIYDNTEREFKLILPEGAYEIIVNGVAFENLSVSEEIACVDCSVEISYTFPGIIKNDSGNYTFYRKIEMPINTSDMTYRIILPENHSLFNISNLQTSIIPNPTSIIDNSTFEWQYDAPQFPKEFAIRYREDIIIKQGINYSSIILTALITFFVLSIISLLMIFIKKRK